jgi:hypothetical protein
LNRVSHFCLELASDYNPTNASFVAGIIGVNYHTWPF